MYSKTNTAGDLDNNNVCFRKNSSPTLAGRRLGLKGLFWKKTGVECNNCGSEKPQDAVGLTREEVMAIRNRFPTKIPIIIRRYHRDSRLPDLGKHRFLVPQELSMSQLQTMIRGRIKLHPNQALYLLVNDKSMVSLSLTIGEVYVAHAHCDGFLYVTYAAQDVFGDDTQYKNYNDKKNCERELVSIRKL